MTDNAVNDNDDVPVATKERHKIDMVCTCSDEGRERAASLRARALDILTDDMTPAVTAEDFLSNAVSWLWWGNSAELSMAVDQWFGAYAEVGGEEPLRVAVECDHLEDGIAALVVWFYERSGGTS